MEVNLACLMCKTCVMKAVAKLEGINEITLDAAKGTVIVIGEVDPVLIVKQLRKTGKAAETDNVGPPKKEEPKAKPLPPCCGVCQPVTVGFVTFDDLTWCTIL